MANDQGMTRMPKAPKSDGDSGEKPAYDLEERTAKFGESVIDFCRQVPEDSVTRSLISQVVRSGTSVGANYCEADDAVSRKEFMNKIGTCKKEAKETKFWLRMLVKAVPKMRGRAIPLWQEAKELLLIFAAIHRQR
jgi:four helix bundle protein